MRQTRSYTLGIRIDPEMQKQIQKRAHESGMKTMEWCRLAIHRALSCDPDLLVLLREVVATRRETRALVKELIQRGELSTERFNFLISETEEKKTQLAQRVLEQARKSASLLPPAGDGE